MNKKIIPILLTVLMLAQVMVGCTKPAEQPSTEPEVREETTVKDGSGIVRGGTLVTSKLQKFSLDPMHYLAEIDDRGVYVQIYEGLISQDANGNFIPQLAVSWENINDTTIEFKLREGVKFHDGDVFNAHAVKFVIDYYTDEANAAKFLTEYKDLDHVEVVDDYTVRFHLKAPNASILATLSAIPGLMISPKSIKEHAADLATYGKNGTGPFMVESYLVDEKLTLVANPNYYEMGADGKPLPYLDKVIINIVTDDAVNATNIRSGEIELLDSVGTSYIDVLDADESVKLLYSNSVTSYCLFMNNLGEPFNDLKVRKAISYAINADEINQFVTKGRGFVEPFFASNTQWFYIPEGGYNYDLDKAKALLAEAGYPNGFPVILTCINRDPDNLIVQVVAEQLKALGLDVTIDNMERTAWVTLMSNTEEGIAECERRGAVMGVARGTIPKVDVYSQMRIWLSQGSKDNYSKYYSDEFEVLLDKLAITYDVAERKAIVADMQKLVLGDAPMRFLHQQKKYAAARSNVHNVTFDWGSIYILKYVWKDS